MPWDLSNAIDQAVRVISWQENLLSEDMPPEWMWPFEEELISWFDEVDRKKAMDNGDEPSDMVQNDLTDRFRRD